MSEILIAGGGIGGLALGQALRRVGVPVRVFERTHERTDWLQGYRIHINPDGARALKECLPAAGWQEFLNTVSKRGNGFGFVDDRLRTLLEFPGELFPEHFGVSRTELRRVLLEGMQDVVSYGKSFNGYEVRPDGKVEVTFDDGTSALGDLLVGADGANSRVRAQLLPHAHRIDTGVLAIAGRNYEALPPELTERSNLVLPRGRGSMFTAVWGGENPYTFWAYADATGQFPDTSTMDGEALRTLAQDKIRDWAPALKDMVGSSDPQSVNVVRIRSAAPVEPWPTGPVTLIGDAIHNMTPMAGIGANTALRDAQLLSRLIIGQRDLTAAVSTYEREMLSYGFAAVKRSLRNAKQAASPNPVGRAMFRTFLRTASKVPPLRRAMAAGLGS